MSPHPDVPSEQAHLDWAYDCVKTMRGRTQDLLGVAELAATEADSEVTRWHLQRRLGSLDDEGPVLCFGRIDTEMRERWYIGRRHVEDPEGDPVVVDWRAPVAIPFYRATLQDAQGLEKRRRFSVEGPTLIDILEEDFTDPDSMLAAGGIPDPLLAELERSRTGEMRDIVATIAAEQDEVIRAPLDEVLVVQGGPGTGKTAVALHRAAFLLYEHRDTLNLQRVLVVGPNSVFLRYISGVLPSLGETAVVQTTVEGLMTSRFRPGGPEDEVAARLKGDHRMTEVIARALAARRRPPKDQSVLTTSWGTVRLEADVIGELIDEIAARKVPYNVGREALRNQVLHYAYARHEARAEVPALKARFVADTRSDRPFMKLIDSWWPALSATTVVRQLVSSRVALRRAADGILTAEEQKALLRSVAKKVADERWSPAELTLLDETEFQLAGVRQTYGHVVVDEAQDLSAMAMRMLARRAERGSMTIVGDLAQATRPWSQTDWTDVLGVVAGSGGAAARVEELTVGYRVPAGILDLANRLLPEAAPNVTPARSVRPTGDPPEVVEVASAAELPSAAVAHAVALAGRFGSVALLAPPDLHDALTEVLAQGDVPWARAERAGLGERITLLDPLTAKGLEFDAVTVVEPAAIAAGGAAGVRGLFVAMTRAVQHLALVHHQPLPELLEPRDS